MDEEIWEKKGKNNLEGNWLDVNETTKH